MGAMMTKTRRAPAGARGRQVVWQVKFKLELPPRYDGIPDSAEFLKLYALSIKATNGDDKVVANWFPMALKDGTCSWLMHLPEGSISSWDEIREQFIANFQSTRDRALTVNDQRRVKQCLGKTLRKYI